MSSIQDLRINMLPLSESTFRLQDSLYLTDSLSDNAYGRRTVCQQTPLKTGICILFFCLSGRLRTQINHQWLEVTPNQILIINPGTLMENTNVDTGDEIILMAFNRETMLQSFPVKGVSTILISTYSLPFYLWSMPQTDMNHIAALYRATRDILNSENDRSFQSDVIQGFARIVVSILNRQAFILSDDPSQKQTYAQSVVSKFLMNVSRHYIEKREVSFYADKAALSPKHFSRLVIRVTGKRPLKHIQDRVALEAEYMLLTRKYSISQIADILRFSNSSSFSRFFRKATGETPAAFLKKRL